MKKIISIVLAVMLVVSVTAVSFGAVSNYDPADSYTVDANTPYSEEAIDACGGDSENESQTLYFQVPLDDGVEGHGGWYNKFNTFAGPDDDEDYMHVCIYWWSGTAGDKDHGWPSGKGCTWVGYQAHLVDKEFRIYSAKVPNDGGTPVVVWNNGVNAGMDSSAEIFKYGRQIMDANIEGAEEDEYDTIPEGTPDPDCMDGCIQIINYDEYQDNPLTGFPSYGSNWYIYYGQGCYGNYAKTSENFVSQFENCKNPEHWVNGEHIDIKLPAEKGDANDDGEIDINDVTCIQRHLAELPAPAGEGWDENAADADSDGYVSIIDATRVQRYLAYICNMDGTKPRKDS